MTRPGETATADPKLVDRLLGFIEDELVPVTRTGVDAGNKVFGAGMLRKSDLSTIVVGTNNETRNPLWHGEVHTIKLYHDRVDDDPSCRVDPKDVLFISSHEPCTLCLSAITWAGFDNCYYLFSHEDSRDSFNIGHDLRILKAVFGLEPGTYARTNEYWTAYGIRDLAGRCEEPARATFRQRIEAIEAAYARLSDVYQREHKGRGRSASIPLP